MVFWDVPNEVYIPKQRSQIPKVVQDVAGCYFVDMCAVCTLESVCRMVVPPPPGQSSFQKFLAVWPIITSLLMLTVALVGGWFGSQLHINRVDWQYEESRRDRQEIHLVMKEQELRMQQLEKNYVRIETLLNEILKESRGGTR